MIKYLLVEGVTDVAFIKYICLKNNITKKFNDFKEENNEYKYEDFIIVDLNGQDNLEKFLIRLEKKIIKISEIAIIQDADDDFQKSMENINNAIKKSNINQKKELIKKENIFLTPNNEDLGDLEILLLSTIEDNNIVKCFEPYKKCLQENNTIYEKALNKGQVYAYTMYSQSGENLHRPQDSFMHKNNKKYTDTGLWDFKKDEFKPLIDFVSKIFQNNQ